MKRSFKNLFGLIPEKETFEEEIIEEIKEETEKVEKETKKDIKRILENSKKYIIIAEIDGDNFEYISNDDEFDVDFRNQCKEIIREDIFNKIGPEAYEARLDVFETDLFNAFKEIDYQTARADYAEAMLEYTRAINDINVSSMKSHNFQKLWNHVEERKRILDNIENQL